MYASPKCRHHHNREYAGYLIADDTPRGGGKPIIHASTAARAGQSSGKVGIHLRTGGVNSRHQHSQRPPRPRVECRLAD